MTLKSIENVDMLDNVDITNKEWLDFVLKHPEASIFHHPAWSQLLADCYGYDTFVIALKNETGKIVAGIPVVETGNNILGKKWISLPFSDHCSVLSANESALKLFTSKLIALNKLNGLQSLEIRSELGIESGAYMNPNYILSSLKLESDPAVVFSNFSKKFRQYSRKAEKNGLRTFSKNISDGMDIFYNLHLKTRVKLGLPIQPKRFFFLLGERIINRGFGKIILVQDGENKPISGAMMLYYKDRAMIKYSATDPDYLHKRAHYFNFWKCIEWACHNGMSAIDFGRTEMDNQGLLKFKKGWGAKEILLSYTILTNRPLKESKGHLMMAMRKIIQNSPPWVSRVLGELFYKYAA